MRAVEVNPTNLPGREDGRAGRSGAEENCDWRARLRSRFSLRAWQRIHCPVRVRKEPRLPYSRTGFSSPFKDQEKPQAEASV